MSKVQVDKVVNLSDDGAPQLTYGAELPVGYGLTGAGGLNITGVVTAASAVFSGNVTIGGTLTYEDVTNIDVVGVSTFAGRMNVNSTLEANEGLNVTAGVSTFAGNLSVAQNIIHTGDTDTKIHFSAADQISFDTGGTTRLNITSSGNLEMPNDTDYIKIGASGDLQLVHTSGVSYISDSGSPLELRSDTFKVASGVGTERLRIASDGKVRINCTSQPSATVSGYQFDGGGYNSLRISQGGGTSGTDSSGVTVYGGGSSTTIGAAAAMGSSLNLINTNNTDNNQNSVNFSNSNSLAVATVIGKNDSHSSRNGSLIFATSSAAAPAERLRIDSSGRVLIGTTTEGNVSADDLTIATDANTGITLRSGSSSNGNIFFSDATSGNAELAGYIQYDHSSNYMRFGTSESERLRIDSSGRLMIGTTDASQFNSSADDFVISRAGHAGITIDSTSSHNSSVFFADGPTGTEAYRGYVQYSHSSDELRLGAAGTDQVQITSGNVEIVDGDLVIGTSGHGINFAATGDGNGTDSSELLADYEEGTWTPTNTIGLTLVVNNTAYYVKVGKLVTVWFDISFRGYADSAQCSAIEGLPYAASSSSNYHSQSYNVWYSGTNTSARDYDDDNTLIYINGGESRISIYSVSGGHLRVRSWAVVDSNTGRRMRGTMTYMSA